jgi:DNA-binding MarR family transcriptional regulator
MDDREPDLRMIHLLRGLTIELELFGARFAAEHRLHPTDVRALVELLDAGRAGITATPGWLGGRLGMNSAAVTALIDRLERLGHVRRERDDRDRRRVLLVVTPEAVALGWSFFGPLIDGMVAAMRSFDEAELATVRRFLTGMSEVVATGRNAGPTG